MSFRYFSTPVSPMSADFLLSNILLPVTSILGVRRCRGGRLITCLIGCFACKTKGFSMCCYRRAFVLSLVLSADGLVSVCLCLSVSVSVTLGSSRCVGSLVMMPDEPDPEPRPQPIDRARVRWHWLRLCYSVLRRLHRWRCLRALRELED